MQDQMKRGRSQVIWRYMPGAPFRYNDNQGWCEVTDVKLQNQQALTGALAEAVRSTLNYWSAIGPIGFPDPVNQAGKYTVGEPFYVVYTAWPLVFTCRECGRVHFYRELSRLRQVNERLRCMTCKRDGMLRQVPYAYICECGRIDSVFIPQHPDHTIQFVNKGSFRESYWYCKDCGKPLYRNAREGLGFRRCTCSPKKGMRGIPLDDTSAYYSQTVNMVEIEPAAIDRWRDNPRFSDLLLAATLREPCYSPRHLLDLANWRASSVELSSELAAMRQLLLERGMAEDQADALVRQSAKAGGTDPWAPYDVALTSATTETGSRDWSAVRRSVEYVFVRDEPKAVAIPLKKLIAEAEERGDAESATRLQSESALAAELGLINLQIVQALPVLLAGIGFTRHAASPVATEATSPADQTRPVALRPYALQDGKIPVYTARNTTEALLYELDPWRVAAFLATNTSCTVPVSARQSIASIMAWLIGLWSKLIERGESHLVLTSYEQDRGEEADEVSGLSFGLLHTVSHALKATAHRYVGIDNDSLAEYLFPAHAAGLLYASSNVEFTLGGIDAVFRANLGQWLGSARDFAGSCSFDPVCSQTGGACLACLYPKFGCSYFNRTLSRAFLFGGSIQGRTEPLVGYWTHEIDNAAEELANP